MRLCGSSSVPKENKQRDGEKGDEEDKEKEEEEQCHPEKRESTTEAASPVQDYTLAC